MMRRRREKIAENTIGDSVLDLAWGGAFARWGPGESTMELMRLRYTQCINIKVR